MEADGTDPWFLAVGASGHEGLDDIRSLLKVLPPRPNLIVMVVLHRPFDRASNLRRVLQVATRMPVVVAGQGERLERATVYIGEPDAHLTLLQLATGGISKDEDARHRNRTVDLLFKSIAAHAGARGIGVVLAGSLDDGSQGLEAIHRAGGKTMAVLRSPRNPGMPENAIAYDGPIDVIGSTDQIAAQILALSAEPLRSAASPRPAA